jgi:hypothetical protein
MGFPRPDQGATLTACVLMGFRMWATQKV